MLTDLFLPLSIVLGLLCYSLIAKCYLMPWLSRQSRKDALTPLLLLHGFRYIGLAFLIHGVTAEVLDPRFANPAAYGDLLAAFLALLALCTLRLNASVAIPLVWVFNIVGFLDLLNALFQGFRHNAAGHLGSTYFIPAVIVPLLLVTHIIIFKLLLTQPSTAAESS